MKNNINEQNKIEVVVSDPTLQQSEEEYVLYLIQGVDQRGNFKIMHRYSEFSNLRFILTHRWLYCYIPSLPPKVIQGNLSSEMIFQRMMMLDHFLKQIANHQFLWYSEEVQIFLRADQHLINQEIIIQLDNYQLLISTFRALTEKVVDAQCEAKIEQFSLFLKNTKPILEQFKKTMKEKINFNKKQSEQILIFQQYFLSEYKSILQIDKLQPRFRSSSRLTLEEKNKLALDDNQKQFLIFHVHLKMQLSEFKILEELLSLRKQLKQEIVQNNNELKSKVQSVSNLQNGQLTILQKLFVNPELEMEKQINQLKLLEQELAQKETVFQIMTNKFDLDIDQLKNDFSHNYQYSLKMMSSIFQKNARKNLQFYQNLLQEYQEMGV